MSEKLYSWLLYLYPPAFREAHGEDSLQLFRDRLRDETGCLSRARLWFDIGFDLFITAWHLRIQPPAAATNSSGGIMFLLPPDEPLHPAVMFFAFAAALTLYSFIGVLVQHTTTADSFGAPGRSQSAEANSRTAHTSDNASGRGTGKDENSAAPSDKSASSGTASESERQFIIDSVVTNLKQHYPDHVVAQQIEESLVAHFSRGDDAAATDGTFAALLTDQLRHVSGDRDLQVAYTAASFPESSDETMQTFEKQKRNDCSFTKPEMLPDRIAFLKLDRLLAPSDCGFSALAALKPLNRADAIVIDFRDSRDGSSETFSVISSNFIDRVDGRGKMPLYILSSSRTMSAADQLTHDLKRLRHSALGEVPTSDSDTDVWHPIGDHYAIAIPEDRATNIYDQHGSHDARLQPPTRVASAMAFSTAIRFARDELQQQKRLPQHD